MRCTNVSMNHLQSYLKIFIDLFEGRMTVRAEGERQRGSALPSSRLLLEWPAQLDPGQVEASNQKLGLPWRRREPKYLGYLLLLSQKH